MFVADFKDLFLKQSRGSLDFSHAESCEKTSNGEEQVGSSGLQVTTSRAFEGCQRPGAGSLEEQLHDTALRRAALLTSRAAGKPSGAKRFHRGATRLPSHKAPGEPK